MLHDDTAMIGHLAKLAHESKYRRLAVMMVSKKLNAVKFAMLAAILLSGCATARKASRAAVREVKSVPENLHPRTKYQKSVLAYSIIPGGGWIYECNETKGPCENDVSPGVAYFLATAGLVAVGINGIRQHNGAQTAAAAGGLFVVRFADILGAMKAAKRADK